MLLKSTVSVEYQNKDVAKTLSKRIENFQLNSQVLSHLWSSVAYIEFLLCTSIHFSD